MSSSSEPESSSDEDYKQEDDDQGSSSSSHESASRSSSDTDGKSRARTRRGRNGTPTSAASKSPLTSTSASTSTSLSSSRSPPGNSREDGGRSKSTRTVKAGASLLWREEDSKDYGAGDEEDDDEDEEEEDERKLRSKVKQRGGGSGRNYGSGNGSAKGKSVPAPAPKRRRTGGTSRNSTSATAAAVNYNPGWTTKPSSKSPPSKQSLAWDKAREKPSEHIKHFFEFMRQKEEKLTQHPVHIILSDDESTDKHTETASADGASRPPLSTHKSTILAPNSDSDFDPSPIKPRVHVIPDSPLQRAGAPLFPSKVSQSSENTEISSPIKGDCASSPGESSNTKCTSNSDGMLECPICGLTMPRWRENDMQTHINHELNKAESIPANAHPLSTGAFKLPPELEETSSEEDLPPQMRTIWERKKNALSEIRQRRRLSSLSSDDIPSRSPPASPNKPVANEEKPKTTPPRKSLLLSVFAGSDNENEDNTPSSSTSQRVRLRKTCEINSTPSSARTAASPIIIDDTSPKKEDVATDSSASAEMTSSGEDSTSSNDKVPPKRVTKPNKHMSVESQLICENHSKTMNARLETWESPEGSSGSSTSSTRVAQPSSLKRDLYPYQLAGLNWLYLLHQMEMNGILADEMGLGKTVQVIALLALLHENGDIGPHLIVVPATLISNWERELASWCPNLEVSTYYGLEKERYEMRQEYLSEGYSFNVMLTTYTVCQRKGDKHFLSKLPWTYVILDEAQNIKNAVSKRFTSLVKIPSKRRLLLTGTPLQNNLKELWTLLQFLMPTLFEGPRDDLFKLLSLKSQSEKNTQRIKSILAPFMLRRLKTQVIKHLPKKVESIKPVKMAAVQESLYTSIMQKSRTAWADSRITLTSAMRKEKQSAPSKKEADVRRLLKNLLMELRKMANHPVLYLIAKGLHENHDSSFAGVSLERIVEELQNYSDFELHLLCGDRTFLVQHCLSEKELLESSGKLMCLKDLVQTLPSQGHKILIFSQMTKMLDIIELMLESIPVKYLRLDGSTPVAERADVIDNFNSNATISIMLLSTLAGGLGINLTSADTVIFYDLAFNPQVDSQAQDRCHRVGQQRTVTVYKLIAQGTIDKHILDMAARKLELHDEILEEGSCARSPSVSRMPAKKITRLFDALFA